MPFSTKKSSETITSLKLQLFIIFESLKSKIMVCFCKTSNKLKEAYNIIF
jgi:hypothetical protein